jgi:hypothetical protein
VSGRLVVYLDTNFLSELANASLGRLNGSAGQRAEEASALFTSLVDSRVAIFPDSWSRQDEVELRADPEFEDAVRKVAASLSRGVRFHPEHHILENQIAQVFAAHLDGTEYVATWQEAFPCDPCGAIPGHLERKATHSWVTSDSQRRQHRRQLKRLFVNHHDQRARQRANVTLTYENLKPANAREYAEMIVLGPARRLLRRLLLGERLDFADTIVGSMVGAAMEVATERGDISPIRFWKFANSAAILKVPAIDIWASIETSIELDERSRGWEDGDHYDLEALSAVLPYCDAVFCDRNMKAILGRHHIAATYAAAVYSMRDFHQFRRDVEAGPTGRLKAMDCHVGPIAERWDQVTEHLVHVAHAVDPERWDEASPYPGWTYKDLLAHLATGYTVRLAQLRGLVEKGELGAQPDADAANAENIARHRESSPEALVEEMVRQRSEVRRLMGLLRPEHLEARTAVRRRGQPPREGSFLEALQYWHEHDLAHAADLSPIMRWPVAPPEV